MSQPEDGSAFTAGPSSVIGRAGEPRAIELTKGLLEHQGFAVSLKSSQDSRGEDKIFSILGTDYNGQVTTIPGAPDFWRVAMKGSTATVVTPQHAASWLAASIEKKTRAMSPEQRANTILILDAHDWGDRLAKTEIVAHLNDSTANPADKHGLAGIAIAGNSLSNSTWVGGRLR